MKIKYRNYVTVTIFFIIDRLQQKPSDNECEGKMQKRKKRRYKLSTKKEKTLEPIANTLQT